MRRLFAKLALIGGAMLLVWFLFEVGLRLAGISYPSFYAWDRECGHVLRPGVRGWSTQEGRAFVEINEDGQRDREHTIQKPAGVYRIAVLGDSYAAAFQVSRKDAFWAVMERELRGCGALSDRRIEVINFGVPGYGTAQELQTLRHRAAPYEPDLVLLAFLSANDVRNNSRALEGEASRPYFERVGNKLKLDDRFRNPPPLRGRFPRLFSIYDGLIGHSRCLQVLQQARSVIRIRIGEHRRAEAASRSHASARSAERSVDRRPEKIPGIEVGLDQQIYSTPSDPVWEEAWRVSEALILAIRDQSRRMGADFVVAAVSNSIQVHPEPGVRARAAAVLGVGDLDYPQRRIAELAEREHLFFVDLIPPLREEATTSGRFLHGSIESHGMGHWNRDGHRIAGLWLARSICRFLSPTGAPRR